MNQSVLEDLQKPHVIKPWYKKPWRIFFSLILLLITLTIVWFIYKVNFYRQSLAEGNYSAFGSQIVDIRQLVKKDGATNRLQLETLDDPSWGPAEAKLTIVEFSDFGCPFCQQNYPVINQLKQDYQDSVRFIYRDFPVTYTHPQANIAAQAGECAQDQNLFWPMHDLLFQKQDTYTTKDELIGFADELGLEKNKFSQCLNDGVYEAETINDLTEGVSFGVTGTPTFFINGQRLSGVVSYETFVNIIESQLKIN